MGFLDRPLTAFGTTAGTAAQGNDSRIVGAAQKSANLSDLASATTARANLGLTGTRDPYLGAVATRGRIPTGTVASSIYKQTMSWDPVVATDTITAASLLYTAINGLGEVSASAGPGTVKAAIEYPLGTRTPITFASGSSTGTIPANDHLVSDLVTLTTKIPAGATFWVGTYVQWTGTNTPVMNDSLTELPASVSQASYQASPTTVTDTTSTGARNSGGLNARDCYRQTAVLAMTTRASFFIAGDSRSRGALSWSLIADKFGLVGLAEQVLGTTFGIINAAANSDRYDYALSGTGNNYVKRLALSAYCSHILDDYGINSVWTDSSATHQANVAAFRAKFPATKPYFKTTLMPQLTAASSQIALDASDQTPLVGNTTNLVANNNWVRQGGGGILDGFIELEDVVSYKRDSGKYKPAERRVTDAAITTGTATLTSSTAAFTSSDVGKWVHVLGAGSSGAVLNLLITTVNSGTSVTLSGNASTTVSAASAGIGVYAPDGIHPALNLQAVIRDSAASKPLNVIR